jgi:hypothetical protein
MVAKRANAIDVSHAEGDRFRVSTVLPNKQPLELEGELKSVEEGENAGEMLLGMNISEISHSAKKSLGFFLMP